MTETTPEKQQRERDLIRTTRQELILLFLDADPTLKTWLKAVLTVYT